MQRAIDRKRGCLYGLAVGDALGAAVEFKPRGSFEPVTGYRAGGPHGLAAGEWTDDTSMALALADSLADGFDPADQMRRYVRWWREGEYSVNDRCFDIGNTTAAALRRFEQHGDPLTSGSRSESASGNGSIMRLAPVAIRYSDAPTSELARLAEQSSLPTHASETCLAACRYLAVVLAGLINGMPRDEVLDAAFTEDLHLGEHIGRIAAGSFRDCDPKGGGYVVDCLEAALWTFHDADDFRGVVLKAVNLGDDADTTGAVCGQLAGAYWGESGIPAEWRKGLARKDMIERALGVVAA